MSLILGITASSMKSGFDPLSISGCELWMDAADTATISVSGSAVTQWNDKSANARTFTQGTSGNRPLSGTRTQNSLNVIDFDGSDDRLVSTSSAATWNFLHNGAEYTVFFAAVKDGDSYTDLMGNNGNASANIGAAFSEANSLRLAAFVSRGVSGDVVLYNVTSSSTVSGFHYWSAQAKPSDATVANRSAIRYKNGSAITNNADTSSVTASNASFDLTIGDTKGNTTSLPFNGGLGEILLYNSYLSAGDMTKVNDYLAAKWGV
jgi:hypothetical protein